MGGCNHDGHLQRRSGAVSLPPPACGQMPLGGRCAPGREPLSCLCLALPSAVKAPRNPFRAPTTGPLRCPTSPDGLRHISYRVELCRGRILGPLPQSKQLQERAPCPVVLPRPLRNGPGIPRAWPEPGPSRHLLPSGPLWKHLPESLVGSFWGNSPLPQVPGAPRDGPTKSGKGRPSPEGPTARILALGQQP